MLILEPSHEKLNTFISYFKQMGFRDGGLVLPIFGHLSALLVTKKHNLHRPHAKGETGTSKGLFRMWRHSFMSCSHHKATDLTGQTNAHKDWQTTRDDCATCSALQRDNLPTREGKKTLTETRVCSQASLPCPLAVVSCSSRDWRERREDRKRAGSQRQREEGLDPPHPTEVSDHFQLREWGPGPGDGFSSRSCSPASPLEMDVVASYHLGPFTPRIKLLVCPLLAIPLQRAATVDTKAFESGLTAQSREH